jgi:hypothetical protein
LLGSVVVDAVGSVVLVVVVVLLGGADVDTCVVDVEELAEPGVVADVLVVEPEEDVVDLLVEEVDEWDVEHPASTDAIARAPASKPKRRHGFRS